MAKCFITGEELPETKMVKISGDYPVYKKEKGKAVTEYRPCNINISKIIYFNNKMDIIMETVRRRMSDDRKLKDSYPTGFDKSKRLKNKAAGMLT